MCGESLLRPLGFEVMRERVAEVLSSAVTAETLDLRTMLGVSPRFELEVGIEGVVFPVEEFDVGPACAIVGE